MCDLIWVVSDRFHDQKGTIVSGSRLSPRFKNPKKIRNFEIHDSDKFFIPQIDSEQRIGDKLVDSDKDLC